MKHMQAVALLFAVVGIACEAFAYWGLSTASGRLAFDEMAGIVPFATGVSGAVLIAFAALLYWLATRRRS
ncbi:hypothetical protein [Piscinibacter koreensis]|uniref:Uncharacterized protein n=1 Tax=Piscinibacter koreensis TaxID=2742824 RepID=A0A7Y6NRQ8_9BURK|nr:hypothetical protein [Schlegelella koreensis]NUZ07972.1 hypothetical protein [Schlegelella koreensis]